MRTAPPETPLETARRQVREQQERVERLSANIEEMWVLGLKTGEMERLLKIQEGLLAVFNEHVRSWERIELRRNKPRK